LRGVRRETALSAAALSAIGLVVSFRPLAGC
jgi:hypothetical protein